MIAFIGCTKTKRTYACKAVDMYCSALFQKSVLYAHKKNVSRIYILSAKYGLLPCDTVIEPYDDTLIGKTNQQLRQWANKVVEQADVEGIPRNESVMFLCGENYVKNLRLIYKNSCEPLKGLPLGMRLKYLNENK